MKRRLPRWITLVCALAALFLPAIPASPRAEGLPAAGSNDAFAFALYGRLARETGNIFFSPYSLFSALAMTYTGARGETARQMAAVLHLERAGGDLNRAFAALMEDLGTGDEKNELRLANALWGQRGYPFRPEFLAAVEKYYGGHLAEVDYVKEENREKARQAINRWTEERTAGRIKELIKPEPKILTSLTRLVLTNAVYFKGQWASRFEREKTEPAAFRLPGGKKAKAPLMRQWGRFGYAEDERAQVLEMPYAGGRFSMAVVLPREEDGLGALEKNLTVDWIAAMLGRLKPVEIEVFLPRFKAEGSFILNEKLKALGMVDAFELQADFTGMTPKPELYITAAVHQAYVEVNEEGTEAAGATGIVMGLKSAPLSFRADHPFLFFIRDRRSGCLLFLGRLVDPRQVR